MTRSEQLSSLKVATKDKLIRSCYSDELVNFTISELETSNERFKDFAKSHGIHGRLPNPVNLWYSGLGRYAVRAAKQNGLVGIAQEKSNLFSRRTYKREKELTIEEIQKLIYDERRKFGNSQRKLSTLNRTLGRLEAKYGSKQTVLAGAF